MLFWAELQDCYNILSSFINQSANWQTDYFFRQSDFSQKKNKLMKIVILGSGNVARHLVKSFVLTDVEIVQIYSRTLANAKEAAMLPNVKFTNKISEISQNADIYLMCLSDDALKEFAQNKNFKNIISNKLVLHTAGSVNIDILKSLSDNYGVLYPIQTFSKNTEIDLSKVTFCIEANNHENLKEIRHLAEKLSSHIEEINSYQRKILHLSAVFACNFTNNMYAIAAKIMTENGMKFNILIPLIQETTNKIKNTNPFEAQTGPALRNDKDIINEHLIMLKNYPNLSEIYSFVSQNILEFSKFNKNNG